VLQFTTEQDSTQSIRDTLFLFLIARYVRNSGMFRLKTIIYSLKHANITIKQAFFYFYFSFYVFFN
jgi:hypothetical protein